MSELIHRRERIIFTAIDVMNELGVQSLSTKRIAKYQDMSESTVFKHFANKVELLKAVLEFYSQYDEDLIETIQKNNLRGFTGIVFFVETLITYYSSYPAITAITQGLEEMRYEPELRHLVDEIVMRRQGAMKRLIEEGKADGDIVHWVESEILTAMIIGSIQNIINRWRCEGFVTDLRASCDILLKTIRTAYGHRDDAREG